MSQPLTVDQYNKSEKSQKVHRAINSVGIFFVVVIGLLSLKQLILPMYDKVSGLEAVKVERQEMQQLLNDEGLRTCQYKDSLGHKTIGVGHLVLPSENMPKCITTHTAIKIFQKDYRYAKENVERRYPWAEGEVKLILINMTFQLGENRLAGFTETLRLLEAGMYPEAAGELLDSKLYDQTPNRLLRHAARILSLTEV